MCACSSLALIALTHGCPQSPQAPLFEHRESLTRDAGNRALRRQACGPLWSDRHAPKVDPPYGESCDGRKPGTDRQPLRRALVTSCTGDEGAQANKYAAARRAFVVIQG